MTAPVTPAVREALDSCWCCSWWECGGIGVPGVVTAEGSEMCLTHHAEACRREAASEPEPATQESAP
jgi:hypothetical protein